MYISDTARIERLLLDVFNESQIERAEELIRKFIQNEDGEYILAAQHHSTGRCLIFNDQLGRLPLYQATLKGGQCLLIGRSPSSVARLVGSYKPDRLGIMARLLFGYPLDERTEFEAVKSLPEASIVLLERTGRKPRISLGRVCYGGTDNSALKRNSHTDNKVPIAELGESLIAACKRRVTGLNGLFPTLALSGGFDSRLIACAMSKADIEFDAITRSDYLADPRDASTASHVAESLRVKHLTASCGTINSELLFDLVRVSDGTLDGGVAHMLGFLKQVREQFGPARFLFTGDGGDKTVAPLLVPGRSTSRDEVYRLQTSNSSYEIDACLTLLRLTRRDFYEYVQESFETHPGTSAAEKTRALIIRQRMRRWLAVGEDRNRSVFWSTTPFYAPDFFRLSNTIPDKYKQRDRLYLDLLRWFDKDVARIPRPGRGRHSLKDTLLLEGYLQLSRSPFLSKLYRSLKPVRNAGSLNTALVNHLNTAKEMGGGIWELCGSNEVMKLLRDSPTSDFRSRLLSLALKNVASPY